MRSYKELMRIVDKRAHKCRWPGCKMITPSVMTLCKEHWHSLPVEFRRKLNARNRGSGNSALEMNEIERAIQMYKNTSNNSQSRERRKTEHSTHNIHGIDRDVYSDATSDELKLRQNVLNTQLRQIEAKLGQVRAMIAEAALRRGTHSSRGVSIDVEARWQREKRLLIGELNAVQFELLKIKKHLSIRTAQSAKETEKRLEAVFLQLAKEMLAGPVYDRIMIAAIHRIGEKYKGDEMRERP